MKIVLNTLALAVGFAAISSVAAQTRIGVAIYNYDDNFMSLMRKEIVQEAARMKEVNLLLNDSQNAQSIQNNQVDVLVPRVDVLAVNLVDPMAAETIIGKAKLRNMPVVFFNKDPGEKAIQSYEQAYYVGANPPSEAGKIQGELIAKHWQANANFDLNKDGKIQYALLQGELGHPDTAARSQAVIAELNRQGIATEAIFVDSALWKSELAQQKVTTWLASSKADEIEVVIANNDAMAMGALNALKTAGKKLPLFGIDALPEALPLVKSGDLTATVLNDGVSQSKALVQVAQNLATAKPATEGLVWQMQARNLRIPYIGVDKDNLPKF